MSGIYERVQIFLNNIRDDNNVEVNLKDLKVALSSFNEKDLSQFVGSCKLDPLFDCLNSSNKDQILTTCEVLNVLLTALRLTDVCGIYASHLTRALGHPVPEVKVVMLDQLIRVHREVLVFHLIEREPSLMPHIIKCLCHEDVSVGKRAVEFLIKLGKVENGLKTIFQPNFISQLIENIGQNNVYALRVFDVLLELSSSSEQALKFLEEEGLLDRLSTFLRTDDILAMLALVEVCTKLAVTPHGWNYLTRHGFIKQLVEQLVSFEEDPLSSLTYPGISKFFCRVGQVFPSALSEYPEVIQCIFKGVDSDDLNIFISSIEVIGMIAYAPVGKLFLQKQDERYMRHAMGRLYDAATKLPTEWRLRALNTLANIINVEQSDISPEITRLNETWFNQLGSSALKSILQMAQQPFCDVKTAALLVILKMANQKWGQLKIAEFPGFTNFLLDRSIESEAVSLQTKYDILKSIVDSGTGLSTFDREVYQSIEEYVRQGPFYASTSVEVAVERAE